MTVIYQRYWYTILIQIEQVNIVVSRSFVVQTFTVSPQHVIIKIYNKFLNSLLAR